MVPFREQRGKWPPVFMWPISASMALRRRRSSISLGVQPARAASRRLLTIWIYLAMIWDSAPTGKRERQPDYSDAAIQTCLTMKLLFGMALRQTTRFVESLLQLVSLDWDVPDSSTLSRRQKTLKVNIPYRGSDGPLHLLVDSTSIKVEGEGEWNARKHGGTKRRVWRKIQIGIDEKPPKSGRPSLPPATWAMPPSYPSCSTRSQPARRSQPSEPMAPSTPANAEAIFTLSAAAIIPPRKNAKPWKPNTAGAVARNEILQTSKRVGRTFRRRWSGYHRRSLAETKKHCVKLLGQRLCAHDFDRQVAEFQVRVAVLNGFTALGTRITEIAEKVCLENWDLRSAPDLCNRVGVRDTVVRHRLHQAPAPPFVNMA